MIERRDPQTSTAEPRGGIEQNHRVEAAGHGEDNSRVPAQPVLHRPENQRRRVSRAHVEKHSRFGAWSFPREPLERRIWAGYTSVVRFTSQERLTLETHGPLGTLWVGIGLGLFYIALIWLNTLLGFFLTPLFIIPATWLMDQLGVKREPSSKKLTRLRVNSERCSHFGARGRGASPSFFCGPRSR